MANLFNPDFQDFLRSLRQCQVRYVLVGGYSVILHGYSRTTGDLDIWTERTAENYERLVQAFRLFGMPVFDMTLHNFLQNPALDVFTFGRPPAAIDIITQLKGLDFGLIHYQHLLQAKRAAGRPRDQNDIENLRRQKDE